MALFLCKRRVARPDFVLTEENALPIIEICRLLEGMPLGIELAAAWMGLLAPAELLEELAHSPDILRTGSGNVPAGQPSLRAVFDIRYHLGFAGRPGTQRITLPLHLSRWIYAEDRGSGL